MQLTSAPAVIKEVEYSRETKDYAAYVTIDGERQLIGYGKTHTQADDLCNEYAYNFYADNHTPEVAAAIAVEMSEAGPRCPTCGGEGDCPDCDPISCPACQGAHRVQRCPQIGALLFDPAPPVDDDIEDNFGGFRQTIELERRFEFSALPTEWSF